MTGTNLHGAARTTTHACCRTFHAFLFRTFFFTYTSNTSLSDVTRSAAIVLVTLTALRQLGSCYVGEVALDPCDLSSEQAVLIVATPSSSNFEGLTFFHGNTRHTLTVHGDTD